MSDVYRLDMAVMMNSISPYISHVENSSAPVADRTAYQHLDHAIHHAIERGSIPETFHLQIPLGEVFWGETVLHSV